MPWARSRSWSMASRASAARRSSVSTVPCGSLSDGVAGKSEVQREGDELLLGAVVEVAFDAATLGIGRRHQPGPRRPQVGVGDAEVGQGGAQRLVELPVAQEVTETAAELAEGAVLVGRGTGRPRRRARRRARRARRHRDGPGRAGP